MAAITNRMSLSVLPIFFVMIIDILVNELIQIEIKFKYNDKTYVKV